MSIFTLFAERYDDMCSFYAGLLGVEYEAGITPTSLSDGINEVHLHQIPNEFLSDLSLPAVIRSDYPIKPTLQIPLDVITSIPEHLVVKTFQYQGRLYVDVSDPDGNVICLREK